MRSNGDGVPPCWVWPSTTSPGIEEALALLLEEPDRKSVVYSGFAFSFITVRNEPLPGPEALDHCSTSASSPAA